MTQNLQRDVSSQGIIPKQWTAGTQKLLCPRCSHTRQNKDDKCLSFTIKPGGDTAVWNCHNCFWTGGAGKTAQTTSMPVDAKKKVYVEPDMGQKDYQTNLPTMALDFLRTRKITPVAIDRNKLMWLPRGEVLCFPYYDYSGKVINIKHRPLKEKKFWLVADAKIPFYGINEMVNFQEMIIVEGEMDKLALNSCGLWNVVSVPHGAPAKDIDPTRKTDKFDFLIFAEDLLKRMRRVIIAVDNDPAGKVLQRELIRRIGVEKCWTVEFPAKDANDTLIEYGQDIVLDCINDAKECPVKGLYRPSDFEDSITEYYHTEMGRGELTGWPNVDNFYTVMPGELTIVTGVPNSGKSEFLDALTVNLAKFSNWKLAVFSPENMKELHVTKLIEKIMELSADPKNPERMGDTDFARGLAWVAERYCFIVSDDDKDLPTIDWILDKARIAILRYGIRGLIIDPYNEIEHKRGQGMFETEYVSMLLGKIKRFAKANQIHVWIVAHPAKMLKDKEGKQQVPTLYDISGSANWVNKADCGIVIHRGSTEGQTEVHVKKIRFKHVGRQGVANLVYERNSGRYLVPQSELTEPQPGKKSRGNQSFIDFNDPDMRTFGT